jgi:branched-chain amino acid transport system permease protein
VTGWIQHILDGLSLGAIFALIALGYTMVYGVLKLINFAHGDVLMVGAFVASWVAAWALYLGVAPYLWLVTPLAMGVCALVGIAVERIAYRPLRNAPRLAALITAIGISLLLESGGQWLLGAEPRAFPQLIDDRTIGWLKGIGLYMKVSDVVTLGLTLALLAGLHLIAKHTRFGKAMRAVSQDRDAARLMGIPVDRVVMGTFALGSALAAAGGVMWGMKFQSIDPLMGMEPGLRAFVAAVIGGIGSIPGAMVGGFVMGVAETLVAPLSLPLGKLWGSEWVLKGTDYRQAFAFLILIVVLLFRPSGLFGKQERSKV